MCWDPWGEFSISILEACEGIHRINPWIGDLYIYIYIYIYLTRTVHDEEEYKCILIIIVMHIYIYTHYITLSV